MDNTIKQVQHDQCTGCGACYNKCPYNAISMEYDQEGFIFPKIMSSCINCGLCQSVCPVIHPIKFHETPPSYAVWASDAIRAKSSSGGMFSLLANYILSSGGVVCGAAYTDNYKYVKHIWAETEEDLAPLRGSKYVQSDTKLTYKEAKEYLDQERLVLYTGCPCQIAGLYSYLGKKYNNLYTADLVCHGSNSVKAYQSFIKEFSDNQEIQEVNFRDKKFYGWSTPTVIYLKNGDVKKAAWNESTWNKGFLEGVFNRMNCHSCIYAKSERIADITLADCWQVHRYNPNFDDYKGTSLVLINSQQGQNIFTKVRSEMKLCERVPLELLRNYNGQLNHPAPVHRSRKFFFSHLDQLGYHKALRYGTGVHFDIGIVGWWFASNYGSSLTYYALCSILENMGKQILLIPIAKTDGTPFEPETQFTINFLAKHFYIGNARAYDKMNEFNQLCDSFMLGSDQMWTGDSTKLVGYTFFLDFVDKDKKKIAFSTSFGQSDFYAPEEVCATASDYLKRFSAISVREKSGINVCKNRFGIEAEQIFDPIFLCNDADYNRLAEKIHDPINKKYLLCYILDPTPEKENAAKSIAEHENLEILTILGLMEYSFSKNSWHTGTILPQITAEQFVYYIKNCSYLLTDSHHGVCFGIIYKKPYAALANINRGITRFETVAEVLGLSDRLFLDAKEILNSQKIYEPIDYNRVDQLLKIEKERALRWLENALSCSTKKGTDTLLTVAADNKRIITGMSHLIGFLQQRIDQNNKEITLIRKNIDMYLNTNTSKNKHKKFTLRKIFQHFQLTSKHE